MEVWGREEGDTALDLELDTGIGLLWRYVIHSGSVQMNRSLHHS